MNQSSTAKQFKPNDFASDQEIRWCPGCGDYAIIKALRGAMAQIGTDPDNVVCVSGIGCAARLPYYMSCYGLHTIHGRGSAIASGIAQTRPDLDVWLITGDGDGLSIGAGHLLHLLRRRLPLRVLLFNNAVYGLTKGQASPTSPFGMVSPSTPFGNASQPLNPCLFTLAAGAGLVARSVDIMQAHLLDTMVEMNSATCALQRPAFLEIMQNCPVYHDQAQGKYRQRETRDQSLLYLKKGSLLRYGTDQAIRFDAQTLTLQSVKVSSDDDAVAKGVLRHDPNNEMMATLLAKLTDPLPIGILYQAPDTTSQDNQGESREGLPNDAARAQDAAQPCAVSIKELQAMINARSK